MLQVGKINHLQVSRIMPYGVFLTDEENNQVLLPNSHTPDGVAEDQWLDVFVYHDAEGNLMASSDKPKVQLNQCAFLNVVAVRPIGAFLDWGIEKDLFVAKNQQEVTMQEGQKYVVYVYLDRQTGRIAASSKLYEYLEEESFDFKVDQQVDLLISNRTDMGYKAVINGTHLGLIFKDEVFKPIKIGQQIKGYIRNVREDGLIDLSLQLHNAEGRNDLGSQIIAHLQQNDGVSVLTDKSNPNDIYKVFNVSKGAYKKALGLLYKQKRIMITKDKVQLLN
ncbi:S1-like domain-containing RNA-binding protein [Alteromonadaceae bacterium BrNp21-10]|nr:S1-like domain-containing RNA-binding protein [Alteromonadaceae bacterium BrNp21-10]